MPIFLKQRLTLIGQVLHTAPHIGCSAEHDAALHDIFLNAWGQGTKVTPQLTFQGTVIGHGLTPF